MKINGRTVMVCDCTRTMALDGKALAKACGTAAGAEGELSVATQLCRAQLDRFEAQLKTTGAKETGPLLVACTQEAPLFGEIAAEESGDGDGPDAMIAFTNIRERAGWSDEGAQALPKIAALLAEAALDIPPTGTITLASEGTCLVYGTDERAIEAARRLSGSLDVTVLLKNPKDVAPPRVMDVPVFKGTIRAAKGWLGNFEIVVDDYAPSLPASRAVLAFDLPRQGASSRCDVIVDLTGGTPLFPAHG